MNVTNRAYSPHDLPDLLELVSENARARMPEVSYLMTGDVAWRLPGSAPEKNIRLWHDDAGLAGFAWFDPTTDLEFDLRMDLGPGHPVAEQLLAWGESRRLEFEASRPRFIELTSMEQWAQEVLHPRRPQPDDGWCLTARAFERDTGRIALLERRGFRATGHTAPSYRRDLALPIPEPRIEPGMTLRHVTPDDLEERVATHRDSWVGSRFDLERYREVRASEVYDASLDIVLETADGTFSSYCICWADRRAGIGCFEPVGTRPAWRGRGVGREVIHQGLRRLAQTGLNWAQVETAGFNAPARALYETCGFELVDTCHTFMKAASALT